jgi:sec-independent protein translocase protein TatA
MFGIGGGELIFILFVVLMLFGSDKVPEIARTMGKAMAQLKNATNDIKSEIQKGAEANGLDQKLLNDLTSNINSEINSAKKNLLGDTNPLKGISDNIVNEVNTIQKTIAEEPSSILPTQDNVVAETTPNTDIVEEIDGPIKRKK